MVGMAKGQHWQIAIFDFEGCDFHALSYFIFLPSMSRKVLMKFYKEHFDTLLYIDSLMTFS
jgi:hypothetical protein